MIRELDKLPTEGMYRMFGKANINKMTKEQILEEASKLSDNVIWIETMFAAFIPWTMDDYESEGE
jgi:hypothetical protein